MNFHIDGISPQSFHNLGGIWDCSALQFLAKQVQLYATLLQEKGGVVRAPKMVLLKLQFFVELLHGGVCGAEFIEQSQTPP